MVGPALQTRHSRIPSQAEIQAAYDRIYQRQGIRDPLWLYRWALRLLRLRPGARLLDIACGEGHLLAFASHAGFTAWGIELSSTAVRLAHRNAPAASLVLANGERLPFAMGTFDGVVNLGSLEHYLDIDEGIREIARVLRPEGVACVMLPNAFWLGDILEVLWNGRLDPLVQPFERAGTRAQWRELLEVNGLQVIRALRYNKPYPLFDEETGKLKSIRKFLWRGVFNTICPFNLSLAFVYLCRKAARVAARQE